MKNISRFLMLISCILTITNLSLPQWVQTNGSNGSLVYSIAVSGTSLFAGTNGRVFLSTDDGTSWNAANSGLTANFYWCVAVNGTNLFTVSDDGVFLSTNNGTNWTKIRGGNFRSVAVIGTKIFAGMYGGGVNSSADNGTTWSAVNVGLPTNQVTSFLASGTNLFAGTADGVYLSTDNGANWSAVKTGIAVNALAVSGTNLYAGATPSLSRSTDNGTTWSAANAGLPALIVSSLAVSPNGAGGTNLFAGIRGQGGVIYSTTGIYLSTNNGTSWSAVNTGFQAGPDTLRNTNVWSLAVSGKYLLAGTERGLWRLPLSDLTGVEDIKSDGPIKFSLDQNYPNPFNPSTTIFYSLPKTATVSLRIFNALGQEVALLVNERKESGTYQVTWDASNVPSGIYFYRLQAGDFVETKKMILLR